MAPEPWPSLPYEAWQDTCATLHRWAQIVGKIRLSLLPWINHSWHVSLEPTCRGLTTGPMPCGGTTLQIGFDLVGHRLLVRTAEGSVREIPLRAVSVAQFHRELFGHLADLGLPVRIHGRPNELPDATPFAEDTAHASYDPEFVGRFHRVLLGATHALTAFRASFVGKAAPVQFYWGGFDLNLALFSGRPAPPHPGGFPHMPDWVTREAYSHEVYECGFWPGGAMLPEAGFYAYGYPAPRGFPGAPVRPAAARYVEAMGEFFLPYEAIRRGPSPGAAILEFCRSAYAAVADLGGWDRAALERREDPRAGHGRQA